MNLRHRMWRAVTRNVAFTTPDAEDARLKGRTYAIPFEDVWQVTLNLIENELRFWSLVSADDREGIIRAEVKGRLERLQSAVTIRVGLDPDAQTRVDALAACRTGRADLGVNARRLGRYFREMDRRLEEQRSKRTHGATS
jgi:uncharacterized protein (DUF1499 family)